MNTPMTRRWIVLALIGMVALGANPESLNEKVQRLEAENALLKAQVASLKRKLAAKDPLPPATRPAVPVFKTPKDCWQDADLFIEHVRVRDILGLRKPSESPKAWLEENKGFVHKTVTWRGTVKYDERHRGVKSITVMVGKHGGLALRVFGSRSKRVFKGTPVIAQGLIQGIEIEPAEVKDGQIIHGAITVQVQGGLRPAPKS